MEPGTVYLKTCIAFASVTRDLFPESLDNYRGAMSCFMFQSTVKPSEYGDLGEGGIVSVCINGVSVLSGLNLEKIYIRVLFSQGQSKLSVIMRCP